MQRDKKAVGKKSGLKRRKASTSKHATRTATEAAVLKAELRAARERQAASAEVFRAIATTSGDAANALRRIAEITARLFAASSVTIHLAGDGDKWRQSIRWGTSSARVGHELTAAQLGPGGPNLPATVYRTNRQIHVPDLDRLNSTFARWPTFPIARASGTRSIAGTPLRHKGKAIGVLNVHRDRLAPFSKTELALLQSFADQAVIAIENARLFNETKQALERQTASAEVLQVISASLGDLKPVFDQMLAKAMQLCEAQCGFIYQMEQGAMRAVAEIGVPAAFAEYRKHNLHTGGATTPADVVRATKRPAHVHDARDSEPYLSGNPNAVAGVELGGARTVLYVPMIRNDDIVGVINVYRQEVRPFTVEEIALLENFASQAVIAIQNARLFDEVQARTRDLSEALTYQTGSANILSVIASSPTNVQPVLDAIVKSSCELCEAYDAVLVLKEGEELFVGSHYGRVPLNRMRWPNDRSTVSGRAIADRRSVHVSDVTIAATEYPTAAEMSVRDGGRTVLGIPLMREGTSIGAVVLRRTDVDPFNEKQISLLQTFADQAVIAISNVNLFDQVRAKTRDLEETLQQQTATSEVLEIISSSPGDLEQVFQKMLENACRVCEANFGTMNLWNGEVFTIVARQNTPPAFDAFRQQTPIRPHPDSPMARVVRTHRVVHEHDLKTNPAYLAGVPNVVTMVDVAGARTLMNAPMLKEDKLIGTITIFRREARPFTDKQIALIENFTKQAVIAIENARLLKELRERTDDLSMSLEHLRTAQDRLIQTEKLASLGQLTAGIAHEIKNPLNFVNNFSQLSAELVDEMTEVFENAALDEASRRKELDEIRELLKGNLQKVVQHGKRADLIVKNMLLHSREASGELRAAEINGLVEESLNLAYHGARAEKSGFNITLQREFDPSAGAAELFPQEITRALLNLISNGFYAATKRMSENGAADFEPTLSVTTNDLGASVEIRIRDNGTGIASEVKEKMFNPFFTTKPAGEGTGLGLSITHDIIVKQHGGTIRVDTEPGAFTEFILTLPRSTAVQSKQRGTR